MDVESLLVLYTSVQFIMVKNVATSHRKTALGSFHLDSWKKRDDGVLIWLPYQCQPDQGGAQHKAVRGKRDAIDCHTVSEVGPYAARERN